jgi:hypothetical protein
MPLAKAKGELTEERTVDCSDGEGALTAAADVEALMTDTGDAEGGEHTDSEDEAAEETAAAESEGSSSSILKRPPFLASGRGGSDG